MKSNMYTWMLVACIGLVGIGRADIVEYPDDHTTMAYWRTAAALEADGEYGTDGYVLYGYAEGLEYIQNYDESLSNPQNLVLLPAYVSDIVSADQVNDLWGAKRPSAYGNYGFMQEPDNTSVLRPAACLLERTDQTVELVIKRATSDAFRMTLIFCNGEKVPNNVQGIIIDAGSAGSIETEQFSTSGIGVAYKSFDIGAGLDDIKLTITQRTIENTLITGFAFDPRFTEKANRPVPGDGSDDVLRDGTVLSWSPGAFAVEYNVYFGESAEDVNTAGTDSPPFKGTRTETTFPLGRLDLGRMYYWRVDAVNDVDVDSPWIGNVWSFTTEPVGYPIDANNITATASSVFNATTGPENTINGAGLDADDLHSIDQADMWLTSPTGAQPTWIQYDFDKVYKLHEMWVWNFNQAFEAVVGFGLKDVTIESSVDGIEWTQLAGVPEFAQASAAPGYAHNTSVDLGGTAAKYVKITANDNWGSMAQYGLSEVRFFYIPIHAKEPSPADGATNVSVGTIDEPVDVTLGFRAGRQAAMHDVYLSTDEQAVIDGTAPVTTVTETSCGPLSLDVGETYYWRVDEVNEAETPAVWQGDIWNFATQEYFVLDDFEDYNDYPPDEIFSTWEDGWSNPANGALVANPEPPYAETAIVHSGSQSMPYFYDNSVGYSEATVTLSSLRRDWTKRGIGSLSLWFRGYPASVGSFIEAPAGTYTMTASGADIWGTFDELHYAYRELSGPGTIIAKVESVERTHNWARAGVMIRDTLEADSAHAMMVVSANRGLAFELRPTAGEITSRTRQSAFSAPYWVKIERDIGGVVRASYSADGIEWTELSHEQVTMDMPMYIGLALTARNANATCEAIFSNVQITGTASPQWTNQDIGILSNAPEPMYVALANAGGTHAVVYHDDPNAAQIGTWTEWNIDLKGFADQGVNLANLDKLSIGFVDRDNPQAGTSGKMYFDDIGLYPLREPQADLIGN